MKCSLYSVETYTSLELRDKRAYVVLISGEEKGITLSLAKHILQNEAAFLKKKLIGFLSHNKDMEKCNSMLLTVHRAITCRLAMINEVSKYDEETVV